MAKIRIVAGRRVPVKPKTPAQVEKEHKLPAAPKQYKLDGLSLKALYKATPPYIKNNAHDVLVKQLQQATTKGGFPAVKAKILSVTNKKRHVYGAHIIGKEADIPLYKQKHVLVSCQCDFFLYYCEVALNHWGSAKIKFSNGEHPHITNPQLHPMMCKHLVKLTETVMEHKM